MLNNVLNQIFIPDIFLHGFWLPAHMHKHDSRIVTAHHLKKGLGRPYPHNRVDDRRPRIQGMLGYRRLIRIYREGDIHFSGQHSNGRNHAADFFLDGNTRGARPARFTAHIEDIRAFANEPLSLQKGLAQRIFS